MPKVSIIVPIYNVQKYLDRSIQSLTNQTLRDIEIILVNDGSKDDSLSICKKYEQIDKRIKVVDKPNGGVSSARNKGIELATGNYIGFIDPDDWIEADMYENMYKCIASANADMCVCNHWIEVQEKSIEIYNGLQSTIKCEEIYKEIIPAMISTLTIWDKGDIDISRGPCNYLYKKCLLEQYHISFIEGLPIGEDFIFNIDYMSVIEKLAVDPGIYYHYVRNEGSTTHRYRDDWWEIHKRLIQLVEERIKSKEFAKELETRLNTMKLKYVIAAIVNEAHKDNNKTYKERINTLKAIFKEELVAHVLQQYDSRRTSFARKVYCQLLKQKQVRILYGYYRLMNKLRNVK